MQKSYVEPPVRPLLPEQLPFLSIINFVLRHLPLMLVLGVLASAVLLVPVVRSPATYSSTSLVSTGDEAPTSRVLAFLGGGGAAPSAQTYIDLMSAPEFLQSLAQMPLEFPGGKQTAAQYYGKGQKTPESAIEVGAASLSDKITGKIKDPSGWLELTTEGETPAMAHDLNLAVLAQVDSFNARKRRQLSIENQRFAEERLAELGVQVRGAEDRLVAFQERNRDLSPPELRIQAERLSDTVARRRALYSAMQQSYDRERLEAERRLRPLTLMGRPTVPQAPDSRGFGRTIILGLFGGVFLGAIVGAIRDYFKNIKRQASPEYEEYVALRSRLFGWMRLPGRKSAA